MPRPIPADLCKRLGRLLLMLGSDQPGEVVAAANAITRALKAAGRDWHDLTHQLTVEPPPSRSEPRKAPPNRDYDGTQVIDGSYILELIGAIRSSRCYLTPRARQFLTQLEERATERGVCFFTVKQWEWFVKLLQTADIAV